MALPRWLQRFQGEQQTKRAGRARHRRRPLWLEPLEDRTLLDTATWMNPAGGDWNTPSNWSIDRLPSAADDVVIPEFPGTITVTHGSGNTTIRSLVSHEVLILSGGTLSISEASVINHSFNFTAGTLTGAGDLTVNGVFTWNGGTLAGPGRLVVGPDDRLDIQTGTHTFGGRVVDSTAGAVNWLSGTIAGTFDHTGLLNISGAADKHFTGTINKRAGTTVWTGAGRIIANADGAAFNNQSEAIFEAHSDSKITRTVSGPGSAFNNAGTFRAVGAGGGRTDMRLIFNNTGTIEVLSGTLDFTGSASSSTHSGTVQVAAGATLAFSTGTHTIQPGATFTGAGTIRVSGGPVVMDGILNSSIPVTVNAGRWRLAASRLPLCQLQTMAR